MLYVGIIFFMFVLRYALAQNGSARNKIYPYVIFIIFLLSAFRYKVGCDWEGYYWQYVSAASHDLSNLSNVQEPIWWAILALIYKSGLPYPVANVVSSGLFFVGVHTLARRQPDPLGFFVLLFPILVFNMPMSGIRQGAAIGLMCIALTAFVDRRPVKYGFWIVLASGFHSSAMFFLLLLPLAIGRSRSQRLMTRGRLFLATLLAIPGAYVFFLTEAFEVASSRYIETGIDAAGAAFRVGILAVSALYFFALVRKKWANVFPNDYVLVVVGAIGMLSALLLVPVSTVIADRIGYYLIPIQAMIFARLPFLPFRTSAALHSAAPYIGLFAVFTVWSQFSFHFKLCYIPYQTWILGFPGGDPFGF